MREGTDGPPTSDLDNSVPPDTPQEELDYQHDADDSHTTLGEQEETNTQDHNWHSQVELNNSEPLLSQPSQTTTATEDIQMDDNISDPEDSPYSPPNTQDTEVSALTLNSGIVSEDSSAPAPLPLPGALRTLETFPLPEQEILSRLYSRVPVQYQEAFVATAMTHPGISALSSLVVAWNVGEWEKRARRIIGSSQQKPVMHLASISHPGLDCIAVFSMHVQQGHEPVSGSYSLQVMVSLFYVMLVSNRSYRFVFLYTVSCVWFSKNVLWNDFRVARMNHAGPVLIIAAEELSRVIEAPLPITVFIRGALLFGIRKHLHGLFLLHTRRMHLDLI